ncbi:Reverse transcriptase zinc-binding domain [Arabidopsis suecica]|uniref:Reverse transcriptase zinc-binding domain n=1 Tax=Arabidopsis suecica TaxID=45249 RepID=A0A8T2BAG6_ARASU|nr:Reverse transcriptase zinc-binding domain [Arabidopsis suecica]
MRQYLLVKNNEDWQVKADRVRKSVCEVEKDPSAKKAILRLESPTIVHRDVNKDKGVVFGFNDDVVNSQILVCGDLRSKLNAAATVGSSERDWLMNAEYMHTAEDPGTFLALSQPFQDSATVYRPGFFEAGPSGTILKKSNTRKRPQKSVRKTKPKLAGCDYSAQGLQMGLTVGVKEKRKAGNEGLGRSHDLAIPRLKDLRKKHFPEILFLMETMQCRDSLLDLQVLLGYDRLFTVEPVGKCGGLALLWKNSCQLDILFEDKNLIDAQVQFGSSNFFLSCVYGDPDCSKRKVVWEKIIRLGVGRKDRWCMVGDFNATLHNGEKLGGPRRSDNYFKPFTEMVESCGMFELSFSGNKFTWAGRRGDHWIQCRLDRAFVNKDWLDHFPASNQVFLDMRGSDHRPVLIFLVASQASYKGHFRFDSRFLHKPDVKLAIKRAWKPGSSNGGFLVSHRLRACRKALSSWKKKNVMNSLLKIHQLEEALERVQSEVWPNLHQIHVLKTELAKAYRNEEEYWWQRSRQKWLRAGNRNSKYFHGSVKGNRARKRLEKLKNVHGIFQSSEAGKGEVAADYFSSLFKSSNPQSFQDWFSGFPSKVSAEMNENLIAKVTSTEIREAVFSIKASSAPGPDGMTACFFQQFWDIVGQQMIKEVKGFFELGVFPAEWNYTYLCLLPKVQLPLEMVDLRPISLCSVLYKTISKILVSRLQPILPQIVSVNQSAFVSERLITDNILVAHEVIHSLNTRVDISSQFMVVKTDMSKAYDRVEWSYLRALMIAMGFHRKWVDWIMVCVSTVTFSVLINDQPFGMITPQRGIRQGDPLSPFLFVLCTEGLTHLLNKGQKEGQLEGISFTENGPEVHHLLFVDDSLFMCKASLDQCRFLQETLNRYGAATGQVINLSKSSISFGVKVDPLLKVSIQTLMGIFKEGGAGTYLGMPECFSGSKVELLSFLKDRLKAKLSGCAMADFWWNTAEQSKNIHWQSWEKLCLPKDLGGLGFRDIQTFNQSLLAKQAWRILQYPDCLFAKLMKSRYFPQSDFLDASVGTRPSFAWKSILHGRELLKQGLFKNVGNGKTFRVWIDEWIEDADGWRAPLRRNYFFNPDLRVSELIDWDKRDWDPQKLHNKSGDFSVKSAYWLASQSCNLQTRLQAEQLPSTNDLKAKVWSLQTDPKIHVFLWKVLCGALPVASALNYRGMKTDERCQLCGGEEETVNHVLFTCSMARQVWALTGIPSPQWGFENGSVFANIHYLLMNTSNPLWPEDLRGSFPWTLWRIWKNRNLACFEGKGFSSLESVQKIREDWLEWREAQLSGDEGNPTVGSGVSTEVNDLSHVERRDDLGWKPPASSWFKCNIGISWSNRNKFAGCAWVLRNHLGVVLLHSRRAFVRLLDKQEAQFKGLLWAIESMRFHKVENVIFALQAEVLVKAIIRPRAWPSFRYQSMEAGIALSSFKCWNFFLENSSSNRGAFMIAKSVTDECRLQSYVAVGFPSWLEGVFAEERAFASD